MNRLSFIVVATPHTHTHSLSATGIYLLCITAYQLCTRAFIINSEVIESIHACDTPHTHLLPLTTSCMTHPSVYYSAMSNTRVKQ